MKENPGTESTPEELEQKPPAELAEQVEAETRNAGGRKAIISAFETVTIEFARPLTWCGKTYESAILDFTRLTGVDMEAIDEELGNESPAFPTQSRKYQKLLAAKASKIPSDVIEHLSAADYNAVVHAAQLFYSLRADRKGKPRRDIAGPVFQDVHGNRKPYPVLGKHEPFPFQRVGLDAESVRPRTERTRRERGRACENELDRARNGRISPALTPGKSQTAL